MNVGITKEGLMSDVNVLSFAKDMDPNSILSQILETSEKLRKRKEKDINFSKAILNQNGNPILFPHTINVIQGQAGVHKSRLAEFICSAFLKLNGHDNDLLGFKRENFDANYTVVYVDTERNLTEQLPYALQKIQLQAGYDKKEHPENFKYISLLQFPRVHRFSALNTYLQHLKKLTENPIFIVLDVSTDCIEDFNKGDKSMELIDLMNVAINEHDVVFLCLIHENPKSDKARGHFGTELMNKASTVMQVGFEKDSKNNDTDLIRIKYLKCRSTQRFSSFYAKYCNQTKGLVHADSDDISAVVDARKQKANIDEVSEYLILFLEDGSKVSRRELIDRLINEFKAGARTIEDRIKEIVESKIILKKETGESYELIKDSVNKEIRFYLKPIIES